MSRAGRATQAQLTEEAEQVLLLNLLDAEDAEDEELALLLLLAFYEEQHSHGRHGDRGKYNAVKSDDFLDILFDHASDRIFRSWIRMSRAAFWHLHDLISVDNIFVSTGNRPQYPVKYQLAMYLIRNGGEAAIHASNATSVSEGSAYNFQDRVVHAICRLRDRFVFWPYDERREEVLDGFLEHGFPGCLGVIDGSLVRLQSKPVRDFDRYFCRKKFYGLAIQAVVDHKRRFTSYDLGWPASVADVTLLKESHLWKNQKGYFEQTDYILADKGYPLTQHFIRPFGDHELTLDDARRRKNFNFTLSHARIVVEHAFGLLKGRFPVLRHLPGQDLDRLWLLIESFLVVHNIMIEFGDSAEDLPDWDEQQKANREEAKDRLVNPAPVNAGATALRMGMYRRKLLMRHLGI